MSELRFNVPPTTRPYGDIGLKSHPKDRKSGESILRSLVGSLACDPLHLRRSYKVYNRPRGYKTFFMFSSVEHAILNAHKYKKYQEIQFLGSDKPRMLFSNHCWHYNIYEREKIMLS